MSTTQELSDRPQLPPLSVMLVAAGYLLLCGSLFGILNDPERPKWLAGALLVSLITGTAAWYEASRQSKPGASRLLGAGAAVGLIVAIFSGGTAYTIGQLLGAIAVGIAGQYLILSRLWPRAALLPPLGAVLARTLLVPLALTVVIWLADRGPKPSVDPAQRLSSTAHPYEAAISGTLASPAYPMPTSASVSPAPTVDPEVAQLSMTTSLKNLMVMQEGYFADHGVYATRASQLAGAAIPSVALQVLRAGTDGWSAEAGYTGTSLKCYAFLGPTRTYSVLAGQAEMEPMCTW